MRKFLRLTKRKLVIFILLSIIFLLFLLFDLLNCFTFFDIGSVEAFCAILKPFEILFFPIIIPLFADIKLHLNLSLTWIWVSMLLLFFVGYYLLSCFLELIFSKDKQKIRCLFELMNRKKRIVALIIFLILVLLGAIAIKQLLRPIQEIPVSHYPVLPSSPTPDPTSNWKIYTNTEYKYSIQYPINWFQTYFTAKPSEAAIKLKFSQETSKNNQYSFNEAEINIGVEINQSKEVPSKEWYVERIKNIPDYPSSLSADIQTEKMIFLGYPALKVNDQEIYFAKDELIFQINWHYEGETNFQKEAKIKIDQILSTFKFNQ